MHPLAENLWLQPYPLSVLGTHHGRNVTLIRLKSGKTILHSMAPFTPADVAAINALGPPSWLLEAMMLHDTYAKEGKKAFPRVPFLGPPGFTDTVGFPTLELLPAPAEWAGEVEVIAIEGAPMLKEHAVLHVPSRTLIVADLVFNFRADEGGWDRFFHRYIAGFKRYPGMSRIFRLCVKDREAFQASIAKLMEKDFDRLIVGHGEVIEHGAKPLLKRALVDAGLI
ncbi:MAG: Methanol oxidation protein [Verrucomicrobiaceae bacterium]|nr:Methanol oxidation protein [Verrucomicrobiaceae bacterium]